MRQYRSQKLLILFVLFLISGYILCFRLAPSLKNFYKLKQIYIKKSNVQKLLKIRLYKERNLKPLKFNSGNHRFSTNFITILSYINYLEKRGYNIKVKIINKKSLLKSKNIIITLNKISDIGVVFSILKTFMSFPSELNELSIKSGNGINVVIKERLIGLS